VKGPHFAGLHPLSETFAVLLAEFNEEVAERPVTLGGIALGTSREVVNASRIAEYPPNALRDLEHVKQPRGAFRDLPR